MKAKVSKARFYVNLNTKKFGYQKENSRPEVIKSIKQRGYIPILIKINCDEKGIEEAADQLKQAGYKYTLL